MGVKVVYFYKDKQVTKTRLESCLPSRQEFWTHEKIKDKLVVENKAVHLLMVFSWYGHFVNLDVRVNLVS